MSDWFVGPSAFPSADPTQIGVGTVLVSPKGTRWRVTAIDHEGRGATYLMGDGTGVHTWRSYRAVRNWSIVDPLPDGS